MTSRNRTIAEAAVKIQALATGLSSVVYAHRMSMQLDVSETVRIKDVKHIPGDLQKVVYDLLALLDDDDEVGPEPGLTD